MTTFAKGTEYTLVHELEARIITGQVKPGDYLPAERILASQMEVSRPVIHNALIRLEEKGFIRIVPRQGAQVLDYKMSGELGIINSLINCYGRDLNHHMRISILNLLKGHSDLIIADILSNEYDARLELIKDTLAHAMNVTEKDEKVQLFIDLYIQFSEAAVNPFYVMFFNSCRLALHEIGITLVEQDSSYHTLLRLWSSLLRQLKSKDGEKAYAINQTIFNLIIEVWK